MEIYSKDFPDIIHEPDCAALPYVNPGLGTLTEDERSVTGSSAAESFDTVIMREGESDVADISSVEDISSQDTEITQGKCWLNTSKK